MDMIEYYFSLQYKLPNARLRVLQYREEFYRNQTLHSYFTYSEGRWMVRGFRQDVQVVNLLDTLLALERYIEILEFKLKHFRLFLQELPREDRVMLNKKYFHKRELPDTENLRNVEKLCFSEVQEIEEAACFRFKFYEMPDFLIEAAEILDLEDENFTESFSVNFAAMLELLGVGSE
ncbi:hypothetical protein [Trichococcus pasteurii]|uniref:hypothetical protein n=1 Tax=Trichococcus pasteurii TaxID=43064 RepID=UPI00116055DD|nr:hypothetical protein [Trichococcus pasteurii]